MLSYMMYNAGKKRLCHMLTAKVQITMHICVADKRPELSANWIRTLFCMLCII